LVTKGQGIFFVKFSVQALIMGLYVCGLFKRKSKHFVEEISCKRYDKNIKMHGTGIVTFYMKKSTNIMSRG